MSKYNLNTLNLRDLQEAIERNEYSTFPVREWVDDHEDNPVNISALFICPYDGTIYRTPGKCPNPYHPHPRPRSSSRMLHWIIFIPAIIAFTYSLLNNQALVDLIATSLLLITTFIVFTILLGGVIYVWAKVSPESVVRGIRFAGQFIALLSAFFAMIIVSIIQRKFPSLVWWVIEFVVAVMLENYVTDFVVRMVFRYFFPNLDIPEPDNSLEKLIQKCSEDNTPGFSYRLLFLGSCVSVGIWLSTPVFFNGNLAPIWLIPIILSPYLFWLWKFYERLFNIVQHPALLKLIRDDVDISLRVELLTTSVAAAIMPSQNERKENWWQMPLFYFSVLFPPAGLIAIIIFFEL